MNTASKPLTEDQIVEFYREGYIVVKQLVPHDVIDSVVAEAQTVPTDPDGSWTPKCFQFDKPLEDVALHQCLVEPNIINAVEQLFETQARVFFGMLAIVRAKGGRGLPWHQDNQYGPILGRSLNTFVALCDITPDKAILWVAPRTHLMGVQPSKPADKGHHEAVVEPAGGMPLPGMKKGDVCIFDRSTYHRSLKNETDENRYAYAAQYSDINARQSDGRHITISKENPAQKILAWDLHKMFEGALV
jgi:ectoine hydroxylase-related dioxygenase (phytanoyl-CoA dioxygenase family)